MRLVRNVAPGGLDAADEPFESLEGPVTVSLGAVGEAPIDWTSVSCRASKQGSPAATSRLADARPSGHAAV